VTLPKEQARHRIKCVVGYRWAV